ncbi:MAG: 50S ribosomal protein L28 [Elusimicrobia bacterium]|nr:50S ribosomal protein L28 [Elusimicrobiota bacterium]
MAFKCELCGKKPVSGNSYSHSHKASKRLFKPNLQRKKTLVNGVRKAVYICSACLKSGKDLKVS